MQLAQEPSGTQCLMTLLIVRMPQLNFPAGIINHTSHWYHKQRRWGYLPGIYDKYGSSFIILDSNPLGAEGGRNSYFSMEEVIVRSRLWISFKLYLTQKPTFASFYPVCPPNSSRPDLLGYVWQGWGGGWGKGKQVCILHFLTCVPYINSRFS